MENVTMVIVIAPFEFLILERDDYNKQAREQSFVVRGAGFLTPGEPGSDPGHRQCYSA